mmetsp:Transcript_5027/g.10888  ORF Transcript_5027/g.10888 Transcript_5027/m.10888 type:complete len:303 (+) Transcript_5027:95-1003(+)|eukprot:CAMPEP_0202892814 /NCGR_PEP_ID=MMETSP1392-20130828/2502_1 /ASSEMBLY_ACC=CAM_ASM_000868 /TAXON_ID=225041 /ORGANISM="Chlamydomonas chlamydogama, Strain SAG 11-48b" /LENGTH=302 /DNA_ID=CAMNT_0049576911 /DNA_START=95 /DNA_END=1003 /DNA_ORIENTATION=-
MSFDPKDDAKNLEKAMKGFGTDDKTLIAIITSRTAEQLQEVRKAYNAEYGKDLIAEVKSETSGDYERALTGLLLSPAEYDARCCKNAMKGVGTDEQCLIQVLCQRTLKELQAIQVAYLELYGKTLDHDLQGDLGSKSYKFFSRLLKTERPDREVDPEEVQAVAYKLYSAGQGTMGTDEDTFINTITEHSPKFLSSLNEEYGRKHGDTLVRAVHKELGGTLGAALEALLTDHDEFYANLIDKSCAGMGTDEEMLLRVLVGRRARLPTISTVYMKRFGKSIYGRLESEAGGELGKVLLAVTKGV